ncbi:hypothetical protein E1301_Tti013314 [Triplophysa tibetana]|uniref:Uncharacterized protein n=1 Tax=Triplophysa tibetana TaxID=1572043 RepID=A0A5A9N0U4_9TELE|nr:hypothetical protein E1301_Tti013314 [Triplophysa tibetana]
MLQAVQQENAELRRQTSQLPEIISTLQETRQQNAMLHHELQSLKGGRGDRSKPAVTPRWPSETSTPVESPELLATHSPTPAPRVRVPPPPAMRELRPAVVDKCSELAAQFRRMDIPSLTHETGTPKVRHSNSRHPPFSHGLPSQQIEAQVHKQMSPDQRQAYY